MNEQKSTLVHLNELLLNFIKSNGSLNPTAIYYDVSGKKVRVVDLSLLPKDVQDLGQVITTYIAARENSQAYTFADIDEDGDLTISHTTLNPRESWASVAKILGEGEHTHLDVVLIEKLDIPFPLSKMFWEMQNWQTIDEGMAEICQQAYNNIKLQMAQQSNVAMS